MASVEELLVDSLKELVEAELKEFHWHLKNAYNKCISKSEMEKADIFDTVDKMVACFGPEEAVKVMVDILRKMNQNDLAEQLEKKNKQAQAQGNKKASVPAGEQQGHGSLRSQYELSVCHLSYAAYSLADGALPPGAAESWLPSVSVSAADPSDAAGAPDPTR
ncbi:hypothetical protein Q8A67_012509 [Cirrhinus molitorella]|uniref:Pyrin domain-containing protein n=1 Tax=Cirrhinus molitorella TaxID=172907 RepID=A0AA88PJQ0_9TELE|nr:hypothetical protein Q8A67_012509 [Cirrhinus molitorella]